MSRIGNTAINIPESVNVEIEGHKVLVKGPLGELQVQYRPEVKVEKVDQQLIIKRRKEDHLSKSLHGLTRSLIANMVIGVEKGWQRRLELVGVGFRAQISGDKLILNIGYSHPVEISSPEGIKFEVEDNTKIQVSGIDKQLVGSVAADVRRVRPPEPYKGKGIRFAGEHIRRKVGKSGKVGGVK